MKPNLTLLYSELGLRPNCSLAELQLAYRRRISQLQPRRLADPPMTPEAARLLRDLVWLYTTANRFHRRYGRLPGATPQREADFNRHPTRPWANHIRYSAPSSDKPEAASRVLLSLAVMFLVLLFALLAVASGEWLR